MVARDSVDATVDADTPTPESDAPNPNGDNAATSIPWDDIAAAGLWQSSRAACGCSEHRHADDRADEYSGGTGAPATLHDPGRCTRGRSDAELDPRLARHLGVAVPDGATTVSMTPEELAGALRGVPADQALAAVATERAAEAPFTAAGLEHIAAKRSLAADCDAALDAVLAGTLTMEDAAKMFAQIRTKHSIPDQPVHPVAPAAPFKVPPAPGVVPPAGQVPGAAPTPVAPPDPDMAAMAAAAAALAVNPDDVIATKIAERYEEQVQLEFDLASYLGWFDDPTMRAVEMEILMDLTLAERAEVVEAALSGQLHRLGLKIGSFDAKGRGAQRAWLRLREGAAGKWTTDELAPFSDAQMQQLMNPTPVQVTIMQLFYDIGVHLLAGGGGIGKTWIALAACRAAVPPVPIPGRDHPYAVYLDMDQNYELHQRAGWLGMRWEDIQNRRVELMDVPAEAAKRGSGAVAMLRSVVAGLVENPPRVVVVDSLTRIMSELGEDSDNGDAITRVMSIFNDLARVCCVIVLDHTGHGDQTRPKGSAAKKDASRVVLTVEGTGFDAESYPHVIAGGKVHITKDRSGGVKRMHADPSDKTAVPVLGLIRVDFDEANGKAAVEIVPQKAIEAAETRRKSDEGVAAAEEARAAILAAVRDAGAPMAPDAIEKSVWPQFEGREKFTRNDFRKTLKGMFGKELIESGGTGRGGGKRYCLPGQGA